MQFTASFSREPLSGRLPRILPSPRARQAIEQIRRERGAQVIVLTSACATTSIANLVQQRGFVANQYQLLVGRVAGCPVYADSRHITGCPHDVIIIDLGRRSAAIDPARPLLLTRPESEAERQQRVFAERARER